LEKTIIKNAIAAYVVISVTPGYFHNNEADLDLTAFGNLYQETAEIVFTKSNMYCGAIIAPCKTVYRVQWGCPRGGENGVSISSNCNPSYEPERSAAEYIRLWKDAFLSIVEILMIKLEQSTVTVAFSDGDLVYLKNE